MLTSTLFHHAMSGTRLEQTNAIGRRRIHTIAAAAMRVFMLAAAFALGGCNWPWNSESDTSTITLSGTVDAREVDLSFQAGGRIKQLNTDEGQKVQAQQVVAELDARDYDLARERAHAQAVSAHKALAALKAGSRKQDIRAAEAALAEAEANLHLANLEAARISNLVAKHFATQEQFDTVKAQTAVAAAKVETARQQLSLLREGPRKEDIERAAAEQNAAQAAMKTAEQQLSYVKLVNQVTGVISVRLAEAGQVVAAGQPIFRVAELDRPWVRAYLSETDLPRVKLGQPAEVRVDGLPDKVFSGRLSFISPAAEFTPKTVETRALRVDLVYRVKVEVDNAQGQLKIGMPADVKLKTTGHE